MLNKTLFTTQQKIIYNSTKSYELVHMSPMSSFKNSKAILLQQYYSYSYRKKTKQHENAGALFLV